MMVERSRASGTVGRSVRAGAIGFISEVIIFIRIEATVDSVNGIESIMLRKDVRFNDKYNQKR